MKDVRVHYSNSPKYTVSTCHVYSSRQRQGPAAVDGDGGDATQINIRVQHVTYAPIFIGNLCYNISVISTTK